MQTNKPTAFTSEAAKRVSKTAKRVEQTPRNNVGTSIADARNHYRETWVKITGSVLSGSAYKHAWKEERRTALGWEDMPSGKTGTTSTKYAIGTDPTRLVPVDSICRLYWSVDSSGNFQYTIGDALKTKTLSVITGVTCNGDGTITTTSTVITVIDDGT